MWQSNLNAVRWFFFHSQYFAINLIILSDPFIFAYNITNVNVNVCVCAHIKHSVFVFVNAFNHLSHFHDNQSAVENVIYSTQFNRFFFLHFGFQLPNTCRMVIA